jgi:hypothetical protein
MDNLMSPAERAARHKSWLASFGFSERDWRRIRLLVANTTTNYVAAALDDLDVPVRVGSFIPPDSRYKRGGQLLGMIDGRAIIAWEMSEQELRSWERLRQR